jgi:hypothetical protein
LKRKIFNQQASERETLRLRVSTPDWDVPAEFSYSDAVLPERAVLDISFEKVRPSTAGTRA